MRGIPEEDGQLGHAPAVQWLGQVQAGGAECRPAFLDWRSRAGTAVSACQSAADINIEWWRLEDLKAAGDPFFEQEQQDDLLQAYEEAQAVCDASNGASLTALSIYEGCMRGLGLDPTLPSAATGDSPVPAPTPPKPPQPPPPPPSQVPPTTAAAGGGGVGGVAFLAAVLIGGLYLVTQVF